MLPATHQRVYPALDNAAGCLMPAYAYDHTPWALAGVAMPIQDTCFCPRPCSLAVCWCLPTHDHQMFFRLQSAIFPRCRNFTPSCCLQSLAEPRIWASLGRKQWQRIFLSTPGKPRRQSLNNGQNFSNPRQENTLMTTDCGMSSSLPHTLPEGQYV